MGFGYKPYMANENPNFMPLIKSNGESSIFLFLLGPSINYVRTQGEGGGVKPPIHFHCVLHAKTEGGGGPVIM